MERPTDEAMRQAARVGKLEIIVTGPHPYLDENGRGISCLTYHAHFLDGRGSWEVLLDQKLELERLGATTFTPEAEEAAERADEIAGAS